MPRFYPYRVMHFAPSIAKPWQDRAIPSKPYPTDISDEGKMHMAVDTLSNWLAMHVTPADEQERAQVQTLCEHAHQTAQDNEGDLQIVTLPEAKKDCAHAGCLARFRRLSWDYGRLPQVLSDLHFLAFAELKLPQAALVLASVAITQFNKKY
nr:hypothetical protein [Delftia sp. PS-11]KAJ8745022.1 hypothetical protein H9T68_09715 [Delftia sp. PS-11]